MPTEYANTLAATTEAATSFDGTFSVVDGGAEVLSPFRSGPGSVFSAGQGTAWTRRGAASRAMSESFSEGFASSAGEALLHYGEARMAASSEAGQSSLYDIADAGAEAGDEALSSVAESETAMLLRGGGPRSWGTAGGVPPPSSSASARSSRRGDR